MAPWGHAGGHGAARRGATRRGSARRRGEPLPPGPRGGTGAALPAGPLGHGHEHGHWHGSRLGGGSAGPPRGAAPSAPAPARPRPRRRRSHPRRARLRLSAPREVPGQRRLRCYLRGRLTSAPPGAPAIARRPQPPPNRAAGLPPARDGDGAATGTGLSPPLRQGPASLLRCAGPRERCGLPAPLCPPRPPGSVLPELLASPADGEALRGPVPVRGVWNYSPVPTPDTAPIALPSEPGRDGGSRCPVRPCPSL